MEAASQQPGSGVKRVAGDSVGQAPEAAAALSCEPAILAALAGASGVAQSAQERILAVELGQRRLEHVAGADGHAPAGVKVAVGLDREERVAGGAVVGLAACLEELKSPVQGNFGPTEPATGEAVASRSHQRNEFAGLGGREEVEGGTAADGDKAIGPYARGVETAGQARHLGEFAVVEAVGGEGDESGDMFTNQVADGRYGAVKVAGAANAVVRCLGAFDTDLNEPGAELAEAVRHGGIDERAVGEDRKADPRLLGGEGLEQVEEVRPEERLSAGDGDVTPGVGGDGIEQLIELVQDAEQLGEREFRGGRGLLIAVRAAQIAALGDVPLEKHWRLSAAAATAAAATTTAATAAAAAKPAAFTPGARR